MAVTDQSGASVGVKKCSYIFTNMLSDIAMQAQLDHNNNFDIIYMYVYICIYICSALKLLSYPRFCEVLLQVVAAVSSQIDWFLSSKMHLIYIILLLQALAGLAVNLMDALLRHCLWFSMANNFWPLQKKQFGKKWPDTHSFPLGRLVTWECLWVSTGIWSLRIMTECVPLPSTSLSLASWPLEG